MVSLDAIRIDEEKESGGEWFSIPWVSGIRLKIASLSNPGFVKAVRRLQRLATEPADQPDSEYEARVTRALAEHVLLGWDGIDGPDGKPLPYSTDEAEKILGDPTLRHLREWAFLRANDRAAYFRRTLDVAGKV